MCNVLHLMLVVVGVSQLPYLLFYENENLTRNQLDKLPYFYLIKSGERTSPDEITEFSAPSVLEENKQKKVFGFSGIARNDDFQRTVGKAGFIATGYIEFDDHHRYDPGELEDVERTAQNAGATCLITTEKDHARIAHQMPISLDMIVVGVQIAFNREEKDFISFIQSSLQ